MASELDGPVKNGPVMAELGKEPSQTIDAIHTQTVQCLLDGENKADRWLIRWSDWCSPILVKETRQALKSRQFKWTFLLLMLAIVGWTLFAIISMMPAIYFFPAGKTLLMGYLVLLLIPAIVIVPNAAYHSMASELDQGTFDVLSISPLTPLNIVVGKLTVAMVQSLIYFSALAPCIALTYLLRGVPISTIAMTLGWIALMSLVCSSVGLLLASVNRMGAYSTVLSVALILITLVCAMILLYYLAAMMYIAQTIQTEVALSVLASMVIVASYSWLLVLAASAAIGVAGENYSTSIRWWVLLQSTLIVAVFMASVVYMVDHDRSSARNWVHQPLIAMLVILALHWGLVGTFFVGESGTTSPRAQRSLPDTLLSRLFLTWTNPGSGPGYIFVLTSFAAIVMTVLFNRVVYSLASNHYLELVGYGLTLLGHLTVYLGTTRLIVLLIPQNMRGRMVIAIAVMAIQIVAGSFGTLAISYAWNDMGAPDYEWYSILNVFWTYTYFDNVVHFSFLFLAILSAIVFACNLATLTSDITLIRIQAPSRVRQETKAETPIIVEANPFADVR